MFNYLCIELNLVLFKSRKSLVLNVLHCTQTLQRFSSSVMDLMVYIFCFRMWWNNMNNFVLWGSVGGGKERWKTPKMTEEPE